MVGNFFKLIGKAISAAISLAFTLAILVSLVYGSYVAVRVSALIDQPMPGEAQRYVPGVTFREFYDSRVEQLSAWDDLSKADGRGGACKFILLDEPIVGFAVEDFFRVADLRAHPYDADYRTAKTRGLSTVLPTEEILYGDDFIYAWWAYFSNGLWWKVAAHPGFPYIRNGVQVRHCKTTFPVHTAEQANGK